MTSNQVTESPGTTQHPHCPICMSMESQSNDVTEYALTWLDFSGALYALKADHSVTRDGWNGQGQYLTLQQPDLTTLTSLITLPYIYICTTWGDNVPWSASQMDLMADDWRVLHGKQS